MKQKAKQRRLRPNMSAKGPVKVPTVELAANPTMYLNYQNTQRKSLFKIHNKKQYENQNVRVADYLYHRNLILKNTHSSAISFGAYPY